MRCATRSIASCLVAIVPVAMAGAARAVVPDATLCRAAIAGAEAGTAIPGRLLSAIAVVESGRRDPATGTVSPWPWTINVEGIGHTYGSKAAAIAAVQDFQARGARSIDVGCMQVNLLHHPTAFASLDEAFDPASNARYAARFLLQLHAQAGTWPRAAAAYHSWTPEIGDGYARKVLAVWNTERELPAASVPPPFAPPYASPSVPLAFGTGGSLGRVLPMPGGGALPGGGTGPPPGGRGLDDYRSAPTRPAATRLAWAGGPLRRF